MSSDRLGTTFGDYQIEALLGRGGMSVVYLAEHARLGRKVALKLLAPELADDPGFRRRFIHESRVAASIDHPNIVPIYEADERDGQLFIAMRYVKGATLVEVLRIEGRLDPRRTSTIGSQVAAALDAAHAKGLVHRDVKPGNILLARSGNTEHVYLADFGVTKRVGTVSGMTHTGQFVGTVDYVAPEQVRGESVDGRADIYSLGCVVFECLTGHPPFRKDSDIASLMAHLQGEPPRPTSLRPDLPSAIDPTMARALAKRPDDRYAAAGEFAAAVGRALGAMSRDPTPSPLAGRLLQSRGLRRVALAAGALAVAAVVAVVLVAHRSGEARTGSAKGPTGIPSGSATVPPREVARIDPTTGRVVSAIDQTSYGGIATTTGALWIGRRDSLVKVNPQNDQPVDTLDVPKGEDIATFGGTAVVAQAFPFTDIAFVDGSTNRVVSRLDVSDQAGGGCCVWAVAYGLHSVWVTNTTGGRALVQIDPIRHRVRNLIPLSDPATDIAVGEGAAWTSHAGLTSAYVSRIAANRVKKIPVPGTPASIAVGDGAVWIADQTEHNVLRLDASSGALTDTIHVSGAVDIATGYGAVWVSTGGPAIIRLDPGTLVQRTIEVGGTTGPLTVGDGAVWVTTGIS